MTAPSQIYIQTVSVDVLDKQTRIVTLNGTTPQHTKGPVNKYVTVARWNGGVVTKNSSTPEAYLKLSCPKDKENSGMTVKFTMYAVNYYNGTEMTGPPSDTMEQTICEPTIIDLSI